MIVTSEAPSHILKYFTNKNHVGSVLSVKKWFNYTHWLIFPTKTWMNPSTALA